MERLEKKIVGRWKKNCREIGKGGVELCSGLFTLILLKSLVVSLSRKKNCREWEKEKEKEVQRDRKTNCGALLLLVHIDTIAKSRCESVQKKKLQRVGGKKMKRSVERQENELRSVSLCTLILSKSLSRMAESLPRKQNCREQEQEKAIVESRKTRMVGTRKRNCREMEKRI